MNRARKAGVNPRTLPQARDFASSTARPFRAKRLECAGSPALSGPWSPYGCTRTWGPPMNLPVAVGRGSGRAAVFSSLARLGGSLALPDPQPLGGLIRSAS